MPNKTLPKSLHTVSVLGNLVAHFMDADSQYSRDAMERALNVLGYGECVDEHGLILKGYAAAAKIPEVQQMLADVVPPEGAGWSLVSGNGRINTWTRERRLGAGLDATDTTQDAAMRAASNQAYKG